MIWASPEILNRTLVSSADTAVDSVLLMKVKSDQEPICGAGAIELAAVPKKVKSVPVSSGDTAIDSVVLENPKSDPEPA